MSTLGQYVAVNAFKADQDLQSESEFDSYQLRKFMIENRVALYIMSNF